MGYFTMLAAIPGFFLSSFFFMLLWDVIAPKLGWQGIDYPMAMLIPLRSGLRWLLWRQQPVENEIGFVTTDSSNPAN